MNRGTAALRCARPWAPRPRAPRLLVLAGRAATIPAWAVLTRAAQRADRPHSLVCGAVVSIDPRELAGDDVNQQLDQALSGFTPEDMAAMAALQPASPHSDERGRIRGTIIEVRGPDVFVDIGGKSEAYLPLDEFEPDEPPLAGQVRTFIMHGVDGESGQVKLSLKEARHEADLESLQQGDVIEARVTGVNLGGLELAVKGLRAFMPKSQVELHRVEDFAPFIGRRLECEISEIDRKGKTLVVSRRRVLERQREQARQEMKYSLAEGTVRKGVVRRLVDFGAFVDLGGVEGLLHVSDMSYGRIKHPRDMLQVGQEVDVQVLKIDHAKDRISLGLKQLAPDPWNLVEANYRVGATVDGRVLRLVDFGAFVELEPGVEGLLPISELSWTQRVRHPRDLLKEDDLVRVSVLAVDAAKHKLTLSLKALGQDPWKDAAERYPPDSIVSGRVLRLADFGAFIQLEEGIEGMAHISELSDKRVRSVGEVVKVDEVVKVRVKSVDVEQRRVSLSLRIAPPEPAAASAPASAGPGHAAPAHRPQKARKKPLKGGLE